METLIEIFLTFLKIGTLSFGGGHAMIPFAQQEVIANNWLSISEFTDVVAISQISPGALAVNMATFIGFTQGAVAGSIIATFGICLPSFTIVLVIVKFFDKFGEKDIVKYIFYGLRPAVLGLIIGATIILGLSEFFLETDNMTFNIKQVNIKSIFIFIAGLFCLCKLKLNPVVAILASAFVGILIF